MTYPCAPEPSGRAGTSLVTVQHWPEMNTNRRSPTHRPLLAVLGVLILLVSLGSFVAGTGAATASTAVNPRIAPPPTEIVQFESGSFGMWCAVLAAGAIDCGVYGTDDYGVADRAVGGFTSVTLGVDFACALDAAGTADCWGPRLPVDWAADQGDLPFTSLAAGARHVCGLTTSGTIDCWGDDPYYGATADPSGSDFVQVVAGNAHACGLRTTGFVECWGGFDGDGPHDRNDVQFTTIGAGFTHNCGILVDGAVDCWGVDNGNPSEGTTVDQTDTTFTSLDIGGGDQSCARTSAGPIRCWGRIPSSVPDPEDVSAYSIGARISCFTRADGTIDCREPVGPEDSTWSPTITQFAPVAAPLPSTRVGRPISTWTFTGPAAIVTAQTHWSVVEGDLPDGLQLDAETGRLSGTPSDIGTHTFSVGSTTVFGTAVQDVTLAVEPPTFTDVDQFHRFYDDIEWTAADGALLGFPDGTFRPTSPLSRQALATVLWRDAGSPAVAAPSAFADVPANSPFIEPISWAVAEGLMTAPANSFRPTAPLSRQALAVVTWRDAGEPTGHPDPGFTDIEPDHVFYDAIAWVADTGTMVGFADDTFRPTTPVSRQAFAAVWHRLHTDSP